MPRMFVKNKACGRRMPKANVYWKNIPSGSTVMDCGTVFVAVVGGKKAVVNWDSQSAHTAQTRLYAASARGRW